MTERRTSDARALWGAVAHYFSGQLLHPDPVLVATLEAQRAAGLPAQNISGLEGQFLALLAQMQGARRILEIGSLGGYSTVWLARTLPPEGRLIALELQEERADLVRQSAARAELTERVEVRTGPAAVSLRAMTAQGEDPFDFVFLDANKSGYAEYLALCLPLMRPGSVLVADNVARGGQVADPQTQDANAHGIRQFVEALTREPRLSATAVQTVGERGHDGFILARLQEH